ncbi:MAG: hypothetical protein GXY05_13460 [Clostridiales bacterium]|nr:hypothetical protein [Clostridiales bacterium]
MGSVEKTARQDVITGSETDYPVVITKITGRNMYDTPEGQVKADEYQEIDWGLRLGVTRIYGHKKEAAPEEAAANRKRLERLVVRLHCE